MGRIKSTMVKKAAKQLIGTIDVFDDTFETNKKALGRLMPSKPIRNKIAGYIARLKRAEKTPPRIKKEPVNESEFPNRSRSRDMSFN